MSTARIGLNITAKSSTSKLPNTPIKRTAKSASAKWGTLCFGINKMIYATIILFLIFLIVPIPSAADIDPTKCRQPLMNQNLEVQLEVFDL